jgi:hypothetical protein
MLGELQFIVCRGVVLKWRDGLVHNSGVKGMCMKYNDKQRNFLFTVYLTTLSVAQTI